MGVIITMVSCSLLVIIVGILYSCVAISTTYDQGINDQEQEQFLRKYRETKCMK